MAHWINKETARGIFIEAGYPHFFEEDNGDYKDYEGFTDDFNHNTLGEGGVKARISIGSGAPSYATVRFLDVNGDDDEGRYAEFSVGNSRNRLVNWLRRNREHYQSCEVKTAV